MPNSKTLVQTLLAAFCAILCALSSLGGGGMMIGARTAAWAKSGYTAKDYVPDGLVAMWDGIENAGWGQHSDVVDTWIDLKGNINVSNSGYTRCAVEDNCLVFNGSTNGFVSQQLSIGEIKTIETVVMPLSQGVMPCVMRDSSLSFGSGQQNGYFLCCWSADNRNAFQFWDLNVATSYSVIDPDSPRLFKNSAEQVSTVNLGFGNSVGNRITIGCRPGRNNYLHGRIYCVRVYTSELSESQIAANYAIDKARFNLPDWT